MSGKKSIAAAFMAAVVTMTGLFSSCSDQDLDLILKGGEHVVDDIDEKADILLIISRLARTWPIGDGEPRSLISARQSRYLLSDRFNSSVGKSLYSSNTLEKMYSDPDLRKDCEEDGKFLGYIHGKTDGSVTYGEADVYAEVDGRIVCVYNTPEENPVSLGIKTGALGLKVIVDDMGGFIDEEIEHRKEKKRIEDIESRMRRSSDNKYLEID